MRHFCILLLVILHPELIAETSKTICLNMIVKDESPVIRRCLESVKPIIDYWVIVDTGSADGTQEIIKDFMKDIPGELHECPWKNFEYNRNAALALAKNKADYLLFIDADEQLIVTSNFKLPPLDKDFYYITTQFAGTKYDRVQLVNNHLDWKWVGVIHEVILSDQAKTAGTLQNVYDFVSTDGNRSQDPLKFHKDAQVLEQALLKEPGHRRYQFYLAQSYKDAKEYELSLKNYQKRIAMGGWDLEVFWSMLLVGHLQEWLNRPTETIVDSYKAAFKFRPSRAESLYHLAHFYRRAENYQAGYDVAKKGLMIPLSTDNLFVEKWVYDYGLLLEFSICAYWIERYTEALLASQKLLEDPNLPANVRECVQNNMRWIDGKFKASLPDW